MPAGTPPLTTGAVAVQIIVYRRSYPAPGAPVALSLVPFAASQRHTFSAGGREYEAEQSELRVVVPDGAAVDALRNLLGWAGASGPVKSTAREVYDLAAAGAAGFGLPG